MESSSHTKRQRNDDCAQETRMTDTAIEIYVPEQRLGIIVSCMPAFAFDLYDVLLVRYVTPSIRRLLHQRGMLIALLADIAFIVVSFMLPEIRGCWLTTAAPYRSEPRATAL
ncbi:hypothetical protein WT72_30740 [Burkholderia pseudomultivorans]|nr:hypothetical protein WT72_30740 [Burkholderia pseudomultivorans]